MVAHSNYGITILAGAAIALFYLGGCGEKPKPVAPSSQASPPLNRNVLPPAAVAAVPSIPPPQTAEDAKILIDQIRARVQHEFEGQPAELKDIAKLYAVWQEAWMPSFDVALESASRAEIANGQVAPPEILAQMNDTRTTSELFAKGRAGYVSNRQEFEAAYTMTLISSFVCMGTGAEAPAFMGRFDSLPPTKGDVVVFRAFYEGLMFLEHPAVLDDTQFTGWARLVTAKNPVYRLTAAQMFSSVSSDLSQCSSIYRGLLKDSDPAIARIAIIGASQYVTEETSPALHEFQQRQAKLGNTELAEAATKALARIEKRP